MPWTAAAGLRVLVCGREGGCSTSGLPTVYWLGVVSLRVVEPSRPLLYLHPPAWTEPESARVRRRPFAPRRKNHARGGEGAG